MKAADGRERGSSAPEPLIAWLSDVWRHRYLLGALATADFHVRYKRASFGVLWAVFVPMVQAALLALVFSKLGLVRSPVDRQLRRLRAVGGTSRGGTSPPPSAPPSRRSSTGAGSATRCGSPGDPAPRAVLRRWLQPAGVARRAAGGDADRGGRARRRQPPADPGDAAARRPHDVARRSCCRPCTCTSETSGSSCRPGC